MIQIVYFVIEQLVHDLGCRWARLVHERAGERFEIVAAGDRSGPPDEVVTVEAGATTVVVEFAFEPAVEPERRGEAHVAAMTAANGFASLWVVRMAEGAEGIRILIIGHDDAARTFARRVLQRESFVVTEASSGLLGEARALELLPDLILIDWDMPDGQARDAAVRLRGHPFTAGIPIVILSEQRLRAEDKLAALAAGTRGFVTKPVAPEALLQTVRKQLRTRRTEETAATAAAPAPTPPSVTQLVELAELAEQTEAYEDAAQAYGRAAELAGSDVNPDLGNKFRRLAGKMYLTLAESAADPLTIQRAYSAAARAFLAAGNVRLATMSNDLAKTADEIPHAQNGRSLPKPGRAS